jgi:hypothetical protein
MTPGAVVHNRTLRQNSDDDLTRELLEGRRSHLVGRPRAAEFEAVFLDLRDANLRVVDFTNACGPHTYEVPT